MAEIKLYCGFCLHVDTYETKKSLGAKKHANVSSTIKCNKCGRNLNQKNVAK